MIKTIRIMSEDDAVHQIPLMDDVAVISIVDYAIANPVWSDNVKAVFNMRFDDTDNAFNDGSANDGSFTGLRDFIDGLSVDTLIIHCYAGISRSSAVAAAVGEYCGLRLKIWSNKRYKPNILVYELVKKELGLEEK